MDYGLLFSLISVAFLALFGRWRFYNSVRQLEFNRYLREQGITISAVITEAELIRGTNYFKVSYQDEQGHTYSASFSIKDSNDDAWYVAGAEVPVYYDHLRPERAVSDTIVNSSWYRYENILGGAGSFVFGLYLLWKLWPRTT